MDGTRAFTLVLDDPAGNSYVESPAGTSLEKDPLLRLERYERSAAQTAAIGLLPRGVEPELAASAGRLPEISEDDVYHGAAPLGAAAAHRGLARCGAFLWLQASLGCQRLQLGWQAPAFCPAGSCILRSCLLSS